MKNLFEWTPAMSVFDENIDNQHKTLLNQVNVLLSYILEDKNDQVIADAVSFLDRYIFEHLAYEEKYMEIHKYPDIENHKKYHQDFIEHYNDFKKKFDLGVKKETLALEIEQYIGNWWIEHIGKADKKYAIYIRDMEKTK